MEYPERAFGLNDLETLAWTLTWSPTYDDARLHV